jgi:ribosomal protein S18 acetylase RimI-like enzyme
LSSAFLDIGPGPEQNGTVPGIRLATTQDVNAIVELWRSTFPEYADPRRPQRAPRPSIVRKLAFGDGLFWVAEADGVIVGTIMAGYDGHRGWIYSLGVRPDRRRTGLAQSLVATAEETLAKAGCIKVNLQVLDTNATGRAFWEAAGYFADPVVSYGKRLESPATA